MTVAMRLTLIVFLVLVGKSTEATELKNGSLEEWKNGAPVGWNVEIGASRGVGKQSTLSEISGGGLSLSGDGECVQWKLVSQKIAVKPGEYYQLTFDARAKGLSREANQNMNCYAGIITRSPQSGLGPSSFVTITHPEWAPEATTFKVPPGVESAEVAVFLSLTGTLDVRGLVLRHVKAQDSFDVLAAEFSRYYSFFDLKKTDWKKLTRKHARKLKTAKKPEKFKEILRKTLAPLKDAHVWLQMEGGSIEPTYANQPMPNVNYVALLQKLATHETIGRVGAVGRTKEGYGYLVLGTLQGAKEEFQVVEDKLRTLFDAPGLIIDLRGNTGGSEFYAQRLAGYFTDKPLVYAKNLGRCGPAPKDLTETGKRTLQPDGTTHYSKPIVCLTGPLCMSSGEGFALMMKALPQCTLVGMPTRGASGNPQPTALPNGVIVHYSRWISQLPDGTGIEGHGVPVDVKVKHRAPDTTFDAGIRELTKRIKATKKKGD